METPAISSLTCHQLHLNDCQTVLEPAFAFCPQCGTATVSLRSTSHSPSVTVDPATNTASLPLILQGQQPLALSARLEAQSPLCFNARGENLETFSARVKPISTAATRIPLKLNWADSEPPPVDEPRQVALFLTSYDAAPRDPFAVEMTNRARDWDPLYLLVAAPRPARLDIETSLLMLGGRERGRVLSLHNSGETALALRPPLLPAGFEIEAAQRGAGEWTLPPGARKTWKIRATNRAKTGVSKVAILLAAGQQLGQINLLVPAQSDLTTRTRYVLGVDFGTTGTSVWKRDGRDDRLEAEPMRDASAGDLDDATRFPSVLYVSFAGGHERGFFIGYEATRRHKEDAEKGLWVRELKTLLRTDSEPFVAEFGPSYRVDLLLRRYLEKLRAQIINPQLEGGDAATVAWNFSLPVLDSHRGGSKAQFNLQKSRLERAIRDAGYIGAGDALEFFTEPYCAAIYLLLEHGKYRYPTYNQPRDGDWACIFDSGGGTTDVVLGQLHFDEGQLRFEEVSTLGGYLAAEAAPLAPSKTGTKPGAKSANQTATVTFGGEALTRTTAIYLSVWENPQQKSYDFLRYEVAAFKRANPSLDSEATYQGLKEVATLARTDEKIWAQNEIPRADGTLLENGWLRFDNLWDETEKYKRQLASLGTPGAFTQLKLPSLLDDRTSHFVKIQRDEFDRVVVNRRLDAIGAAMRARVFEGENHVPTPVEVKWVFGVGGNCRVRRVGDWLREFFPGDSVQELDIVSGATGTNARLEVDESDRMLAVAGGAVWASKASRDNILPYALRLETERGETVLEAAAFTPLSAIRPQQRIYSVPFEQSLTFRLFIAVKVEGETSPLEGAAGSFIIINLDAGRDGNNEVAQRNITVRAALENRRLVVRSDETGEMTEIFAYNL